MSECPFINVRPLILIDGEENGDLQQALNAFVINRPLSGMAHGEIVATNWIQRGDGGELGYGFQDVGLGKSIDIFMGENQDQVIFSGEITAMEERYGDAAPQIILLIQDKLHILARQRQSRVFEDSSPNDIVSSIAAELGLQADVNISSATATYHQLNESNLAFLTRILNAYGVAFRIKSDTLRARPEEPDTAPLALSARDSALKVRLIADLNHQPTQVSVKGFSAAINETTLGEADGLDQAPNGITASELATQLSWPGEHIVPQPFARSDSEAQAFAQAHFDRLAKRFISGELRCIGEPDLSSGREIELSDVSERFVGKYQVVHTTHSFHSQNGFETCVKVQRADGVA